MPTYLVGISGFVEYKVQAPSEDQATALAYNTYQGIVDPDVVVSDWHMDDLDIIELPPKETLPPGLPLTEPVS